MADDVLAMEQRLSDLRTRMAAARQQNEAGRQRNPTGTTWASARTDRSINTQAYAAQVLATKPVRRQGSAPSRSAGKSAPPESLLDPLLTLAELTVPKPPDRGAASALAAPRKQRFGANKHATPAVNAEAAMDALVDRIAVAPPVGTAPRVIAPTTGDPADGGSSDFGPRRELYAWHPASALARKDETDYEDLLGPEHPPPRAAAGGAGGSLLNGVYDEADAAASFSAAVMAWRSGGSAAGSAAAAPAAHPTSTAAAVPRPGAESAPTLAESVAALTAELGVEAGLPLVDAVRRANAVVGLQGAGTLSQQVQALIATTGVRVGAGVAAATGARVPQSFTTQTKPNYLALLNEQKRRDGLL
jgi:hypothetical protein